MYKAADELQSLQNGMLIFKTALRRILESESTAKTRRAASRLLWSKKRDGVYQKADEELLAARGLKDWTTSDDDLREARKQARTEAKIVFQQAAEATLKTLKHFVEGIDDVCGAREMDPRAKKNDLPQGGGAEARDEERIREARDSRAD